MQNQYYNVTTQVSRVVFEINSRFVLCTEYRGNLNFFAPGPVAVESFESERPAAPKAILPAEYFDASDLVLVGLVSASINIIGL